MASSFFFRNTVAKCSLSLSPCCTAMAALAAVCVANDGFESSNGISFTSTRFSTWHCRSNTSCQATTSAKGKSGQQRFQQNALNTFITRRMTNVGRFSLLSETAQNPSIPVMVLCMTGKPWKTQDFIHLYKDRRIGEKYSRFEAHLDEKRQHFLMPVSMMTSMPYVQPVLYPLIPRTELKDRINDAMKDPLDLDTHLWEARTATGGYIGQSGAIPLSQVQRLQHELDPYDTESLLLFRAHHCMADGVSLGALFGNLMDEGSAIQEKMLQEIAKFKQQRQKMPWWKKMFGLLYYWSWGSLQAIGYQFYLYLVSWTSGRTDPWNILRQAYSARHDFKPGEEVIEPRSLSWIQITSVDEAKRVANFYSKQAKRRITINDVFCSCASAAIAKLLRYHRAVNPWLRNELELPYMNLVIPVHMYGGILLPGQSIGNKIGAMVARIPCEAGITQSDSPEETAYSRLNRISAILTDRKCTPAAILSYMTASVLGYWTTGRSGGSKGKSIKDNDAVHESPSSSWTSWLFEKAHANASVVVTNVRGPDELVHLDGRAVQAILGFLPLPPGIPLGLCVSSYNQQVSLTVTAEPWAVPDADRFLEWVKEEYEILRDQMDVEIPSSSS